MKRVPSKIALYLALSGLLLQSTFHPAFAQDGRAVGVRQTQEKRLALVIGNGAYTNAPPLTNPANDANDMTATLKSLGFEVLSGTNQNKKQMESLIREFGDKLVRQGGVGLFFYAGHGIQVRGSNYLVPIEADIPQEDEVDYAAINLSFLMGKMDAAQNNLNIIILDACRNNPFARKWRNFRDMDINSGLAKVTPPTGTIMLYATQPGNVASDGTGRNGLFTESLLKQIKKPNVELDAMIKLLARDVSDKSNKKQLPWKEGIVLGDFYFAGNTTAQTTPANNANNTEPTITEKDSATREREAWDLVKNSGDAEDFRFYLKEFPQGANAVKAKIRLEETVWESVKNTNNKSKLQGYLNEFPNGANASSARILIRQLEARETANTPNTTPNTSNANKAGAVRKNSIGMEFVYIPAGTFQMGGDKYDNEKPVHSVRISNGFELGRYEVTQGEWKAVMGSAPSGMSDLGEKFFGDRLPVVRVSWEDAQQFISKLNAKNDGYRYRLPTEAEWEYACRAGTSGDYAGDLDSMGWYDKNSGNKPHEVGTKSPNGWGLYDMHGNVWEWVSDWYGSYPSGAVTDPTGPTTGSYRVNRGGSWFNTADLARSARRNYYSPSDRDYRLGFRLLRTPL